MRERHPFSLLLSCFMPGDRAAEITGDLLEEATGRSPFWLLREFAAVLFSFYRVRSLASPGYNMLVSLAVLGAAALVTLFLLVPLSLIHIDVRVLPLMLVLFLLRALACFVVAAAIADGAGRKAAPGIVSAALMMVVILLVRLYALDQGVWMQAANLMGVFQHVIFYMLCSVLPLLAGCFYGLSCRQYRECGYRQVAQ